jgi:NAD-dependent dihydropyrimidine dehydrogenase PreA subunit
MMSIKLVSQSGFDAWVDGLTAARTVYAPQAKGDKFAFDRLDRAAALRLDYDVTILPPKKYFQPQREVLMRFNRKTVEFESVYDEEPFVLFGVHPYDMAAISQMDKVFTMDHFDKHYMARRVAATIVVSSVQTTSSSVFAGCMGHATAQGRTDHDVLLTKLPGGDYVVDPRSEKGDELCEALAQAPEANAAALAAREKVWKQNKANLRQHELKVTPESLPALLERSRTHPVWEEKAELCYSCGSCNFVCPTCYCFDVEDELNWDLETGQRLRRWDGCMLVDFAAVAGGHNFRSKRSARYAHRYYRKGKYSWDTYGEISCVGCGRCITACTANIANPVEIFNTLAERSG